MLVGAMNHPHEDPLDEMAWMAQMGLDFIDLTLEPPGAASWNVDVKAIRDELRRLKMPAVGHTPHYLPLANPIDEIREGAVEELKRCIQIFEAVGVEWMNVHPDDRAPMHDRNYIIKRNIESLKEVLPEARKRGVGVMLENMPGSFNSVSQMGAILDPLPELGLHLDIGHCYLRTTHQTTEDLLEKYGKRLRHVHLHDNKGGYADLHLPLGTGLVDYPFHVRTLQDLGYDGTITLEVFSPDREFLAMSARLLREAWEAVAKV